MQQFSWAAPDYLEDQLSQEERMIRDTARACAETELQPRVAEAFAQAHTDTAIFSELGRQGLLGITDVTPNFPPAGIRAEPFCCA